jgi:nucleoside-diphosphate-sugar epimerase
VIVFRPHNVDGPDMGTEHVIPQLTMRIAHFAGRGNGEIRLSIEGTGQETRAFIYIDDFIEGLCCLEKSGAHRTVYHVGTDREFDIATVAREIARCMGREVRLVPGELRPGSVGRRCPDISRLRKLGFNPQVSLRSGLEQTVRWYCDNLDGHRSARRVA